MRRLGIELFGADNQIGVTRGGRRAVVAVAEIPDGPAASLSSAPSIRICMLPSDRVALNGDMVPVTICEVG